MKLHNLGEVNDFLHTVDRCKGEVWPEDRDGSRINLKSKLSQYVSMANIFSNGEIPELEIVAYEREDIDRLINFMMND